MGFKEEPAEIRLFGIIDLRAVKCCKFPNIRSESIGYF
jgi:hypothetical protein